MIRFLCVTNGLIHLVLYFVAKYMCDALRNLVHSKSNTPPWVFFTFFKLCKWYNIVQRITYVLCEMFHLISKKLMLIPLIAKD